MISIITINYNNKVGLEDTIKSVVEQTYSDYEHIVIDGDSTDGSKDIATTYKDRLSYYISESDTGVYQAMNKGIRKAAGDYLLFLNSGDTFYQKDVLNSVSKIIEGGLDIYYGNVNFIDGAEAEVKQYPENLTFGFFYKTSLGHPASFIKKSLFENTSYYNETYKIVSDWEFLMLAICKHNATYKHMDVVVSNFETNGMSSTFENRERILQERKQVLNDHFPFLMADFKKAEEAEEALKILKTNRFKMLNELEHSKWAKKINSAVLRILLRLFRNKNIKDL
jgi:glycosyltransferase involved in cell wall biosynthesis